MRRFQHGRDRGFTLIELLFVMLLMGILMAIAIGPWQTYGRRQAHIGSTRALVSVLRNSQVNAVAEEATYRVDFAPDGRSVRVFRLTAGVWEPKNTETITDSTITYLSPAFLDPNGVTGTSAYFYARGSGSTGSVTVVGSDTSKRYTVTVEGLTARVSYS